MPIAKSVKDDDLKLERKLAAELLKQWGKAYNDALKEIFTAIPESVSKEAVDFIQNSLLDTLGSAFGNSKNIRDLIKGFITEAYSRAKNKWVKQDALSVPDKKAIAVLSRHNCFWLGEHYGKHISPKIAELTQEALNEGVGRDALASRLKQTLGGEDYKYWDVAASSALVRARSFGTISGMEEAGITEYEILAMGDERTCDICGAMNGKVFSVAETRKVIDRVLDITDPEAFKEAMPWQTEPPTDKSIKQLTDSGENLPPFHGRCRCTLVMVGTASESVSAVGNNNDKILDLESNIVNNKTNGNIPNVKTIEEANELAVKLGIAKKADFSDLDISAVNELIAGVMNAKKTFTELGMLDYVGSMQKMVRNWKHYAQAYAITSNKNPLGIGLNIDKLSPNAIINSKKNLIKDVASKFRPIGCESIKAIIDHEIGHFIDFSFNASKDKQIVGLFRNCKKLGVETMGNSLSRYSNTNIQEFIAEAWCEYQNNKSPRPIAKIIGQRLLDLNEERRQTKNDD